LRIVAIVISIALGDRFHFLRARRLPAYSAYPPNLPDARAFAFAASSSRFFDGALVSNPRKNRIDASAISSMARPNASSFAFDGLLNPLIFRTNCSEAALTSSSVAAGSKLNNVRMFLHIETPLASSTLSPPRQGQPSC
jgi:hypothetical protein